jgi:predicted lipoprotein with Yx(FWY)xxD motif
LIGGYHDLENWWSYVRRMGYLVETAQFSCPALYSAARELADGYPDPGTGDCTALSAAYSVEAVRAFVNLSPKPIETPIALDARALVAAPLPPGLRISRMRGSDVVTTAAGRTLYVLPAGDATCRGDCTRTFAPLRAPWGAIALGAWRTRSMADGTLQWQHGAQPVYACERDAAPGEVNCAQHGWQPLTIRPAAALPPGFTIQPSEMGPILADRDGRTLYRLLGSREEFAREICDRPCMTAQWRPARPTAGERTPAGSFAVTQTGADAVWAYRDSPLYTFVGDTGPGQIAGQRFGGASVSTKNWFSVITVEDALGTTPAMNRKE